MQHVILFDFDFLNYLFIWLLGDLSCSMYDLVPWTGIEPRPPALGAQVLAIGPTGKFPVIFIPVPLIAK